jgi:hypothetical protein
MFTTLMGINYKILYKKGVDNGVGDALSRRPTEEFALCNAISSCHPQWLDELVTSYDSDPHTKDIISRVLLDNSAVAPYTWNQGILIYKNRIWVGSAPDLQ